MGGKALKNAATRRFSKEEYHPFASDLEIRLRRILEGSRVEVVPAYRNKPDFGDVDVLISTDALPSDWTERVAREFLPTETVRNGGVFSFDHGGLQVDLIGAPESSYAFHLAYLSWNESGNIVGRIAHKAGLKYGHDGLHLVVRADGDPEGPSSQPLRPCVVSASIRAAALRLKPAGTAAFARFGEDTRSEAIFRQAQEARKPSVPAPVIRLAPLKTTHGRSGWPVEERPFDVGP